MAKDIEATVESFDYNQFITVNVNWPPYIGWELTLDPILSKYEPIYETFKEVVPAFEDSFEAIESMVEKCMMLPMEAEEAIATVRYELIELRLEEKV